MAAYIVLLGAPGAGKGTQAETISKEFGLTHISTGDIFRENMRENTPLGIEAKKFIDAGQLVPDSVTINMVADRLSKEDCANGALLDGFPRTIAQAEALNEMLSTKFASDVSCVPCIDIDKNVLVERVCGRRMCANGHVFHVKFHPSKVEGICDICGEPLYQRKDDNEETIKSRLEAYETQTAPLVEFYQQSGSLMMVDGNRAIEDVSADILKGIRERI